MATLLQPPDTMLDVIVIGGGPAGLSAALMLARCRRRVVICDAGTPRNRTSTALHGYLTRDGTPPTELLRLARDELARYGVAVQSARVSRVTRRDVGFDVTVESGSRLSARRILIATGVADVLPEVPGFYACYGKSVHHCPYCDGWEHQGRRLAVYGRGRSGAALALSLLTWSDDVRLFTDGPARLGPPLRKRLEDRRIAIDARRLASLEHEGGQLRAVCLRDGDRIGRDALFFTTGQRQQAPFAADLGCEFTRKGTVQTNRFGETCVPGVFVVGDASRDVQFVVVAASEGAKAAVAINQQFQADAGQTLGDS
jgi:thioredoxin reductase